jgi:hypothetical protein
MRMPAVDDIVETEAERVERWRADELVRAGFDPDSALKLAADLSVDIRHAAQMLEQGCPPELALQILL